MTDNNDIDKIQEELNENILRDLNEKSKLRTLIPFIRSEFGFTEDFLNKVVSSTLEMKLQPDNQRTEILMLLLENATSKMVSIENKSIADFLIDKFESISINTESLEEQILSHYGDTIILLNPKVSPLIPNALKIQENLYFINEIQDHIICIDNKDNFFKVEELLDFKNSLHQMGILSFKRLTGYDESGIKVYSLK